MTCSEDYGIGHKNAFFTIYTVENNKVEKIPN